MINLSRVAGANSYSPGFVLALGLMVLTSCLKTIPAPDARLQPVTHVVEIKKFKFQPNTLVVRAGDYVRWENKDIVPHQIAEETLKKWKSDHLQSRDSFILKIEDSTSYICKLHPTMRAEIRVDPGNVQLGN
jgi:plastocyanin